MAVTIDSQTLQNPDEAARHEWIETNGIGGWAGASLAGALTRRYHGLLVTGGPSDPTVRLSKLDETILFKDTHYDLSSNRFQDGIYHPNGHEFLISFTRDLFPVLEYRVGALHLRKTIAAIHGQSTTVIIYEVLEAPHVFSISWKPFVHSRTELSLTHQESERPVRGEINFEAGLFHYRPKGLHSDLFIKVPGADFEPGPVWYRNFEYVEESLRGLEDTEDLFSHGLFRTELAAGDTLGIIVSENNPRDLSVLDLWQEETRRREACFSNGHGSDFRRALNLAADQFLMQTEERPVLAAGYHWSGENLRDTLIALPGLLLATGRYEKARNALKLCAQLVNQGMLPDCPPDQDETPQYNCLDTSLWFFVATYRYMTTTGDEGLVRDELLPVLRDIISWHEIGTRRGLRMDSDGLLYIAASDTPVTWMNGYSDGQATTPRHGKIVEVNALWHNALVIVAELCLRFGHTYDARDYRRTSDRVKNSFQQVFWNKDLGCLYDFVDGDVRNARIRPNQIFALSLPIPLLISSRARKVLKVIENQLLTARGLRTLAADDPDYSGQYIGSPRDRHQAYHQGTVWGWLMGPYITALIRIRPRTGKAQARKLLRDVHESLAIKGVGTLSEIYDGNEPHTPRGCVAHAVAVAEILRIMAELNID